MKGIAPIMFLGLAVISLLVLGVFGQELIGVANILQPASLVIDGCEVAHPLYGTISCENIGRQNPDITTYSCSIWGCGDYTDSAGNHPGQYYITKCGTQDENTNICDYDIICPAGESCKYREDKTPQTFGQWTDFTGTKQLFARSQGATLEVNSGTNPNKPITIIKSYDAYGLVERSRGGIFPKSEKCNLGQLGWTKDFCLSGTFIDTQGKSVTCNELAAEKSDTLAFNTHRNFIIDYYGALDFGEKTPSTVTYQGKKAFCEPIIGGIRIVAYNRIEAGSSSSASCYMIPGNIIDDTNTNPNLECCPAELSANSVCINFQWEAKEITPEIIPEVEEGCITNPNYCAQLFGSEYECSPQNTCQRKAECLFDVGSPGIGCGDGNWYDATATPELDKEIRTCKNGKCIVTRELVECEIGSNRGCIGEDNICCPNIAGCKRPDGSIAPQFTCVRGSSPFKVICGDGFCHKPYENYINCNNDCDKPRTCPSQTIDPIGNLWCRISQALANLVIFLIVGAILVAIGAVVFGFVIPLPFIRSIVFNFKLLFLAWIGISLLLWLVGGIPVAQFYQANIAGVIG